LSENVNNRSALTNHNQTEKTMPAAPAYGFLFLPFELAVFRIKTCLMKKWP